MDDEGGGVSRPLFSFVLKKSEDPVQLDRFQQFCVVKCGVSATVSG